MPELYVGGSWRSAHDEGQRTVRCPADGTTVAVVDEGTGLDSAAAIGAARDAFDAGTWPGWGAQERGGVLARVAYLLERDKSLVARAESLDTGKRFVESELDVDDVVRVFRHYAGAVGAEIGRVVNAGRPDVVSRVVKEPVGVCALITPWNYPLLQASWKVAPCLAAGNTFVLKPSELTPHTAIHLLRLLEEAGLPPGVGNLVLGAGGIVGAPLAEDPRVDLVSFTGGLATGRQLMAAAAGTVKKVSLELGGKNPNIVFADADLETATDFALTAVFLHSGQVCSAGTRLIVHASVKDQLVDQLVERAQKIRLGGPFDELAQTGPLISAGHRDKVDAYVTGAVADGARLRCGGRAPDDPELTQGFYYLPTILDGCRSDMPCVQEESFGPVLTVESFHDEDEAIEMANDSRYGLAGAVWTGQAGRGERVSARLRMGTVWINDYHPYVPQAEWGGYKQSGIGRELGRMGLEEYQETKHIWHNIAPAVQGWFGR